MTCGDNRRSSVGRWEQRKRRELGCRVRHRFAAIAGRFSRVEPRRRARALLLGLLSDVDTRSGWQLAADRRGPVNRLVMRRSESILGGDSHQANVTCLIMDHDLVRSAPRT